jgi:uncharacterized RDD family membrane protein YckC
MAIAINTSPTRVFEPTDVLWRRVGAFVIDELIALLAGVVLSWLLPHDVVRSARIVSFVLAWLAVFVVAQGLTGATPGKVLVGVRVVDEHGRPPGMARALVRSLAWIVDGFPYLVPFVGFVTAAADGDGRRVGDRWAGTYVVASDLAGDPPFPTLHPADGTASRLLLTTAPPLAIARPAPTPPPLEPMYDPLRGTYVRWDPDQAGLVEFDENAHAWRPVA